MGSISFSIKSPDKILKEKGLAAYGRVQQYIDRAALSYAEPFVPKQSGALIASGKGATKIGSGTVCYGAAYARYQYYGRSTKGKSLKYKGGGSRGSYWFDRMKSVYLKTILDGAARVAGAYPDIKPSVGSVKDFIKAPMFVTLSTPTVKPAPVYNTVSSYKPDFMRNFESRFK